MSPSIKVTAVTETLKTRERRSAATTPSPGCTFCGDKRWSPATSVSHMNRTTVVFIHFPLVIEFTQWRFCSPNLGGLPNPARDSGWASPNRAERDHDVCCLGPENRLWFCDRKTTCASLPACNVPGDVNCCEVFEHGPAGTTDLDWGPMLRCFLTVPHRLAWPFLQRITMIVQRTCPEIVMCTRVQGGEQRCGSRPVHGPLRNGMPCTGSRRDAVDGHERN